MGAGLVLEAGVQASAEWRPSRLPSVELRADVSQPLPISEEVARQLLARRPGHLTLRLTHELPIGQGFGMSAAGALASALAVTAVTGGTRPQAVEIAHLADLQGGGGLGGVSAILGGGMEFRQRPGIPPWGKVQHATISGTAFVIVAGAAWPSPSLLTDPRFLRRVKHAAHAGLSRLRARPSLGNFLLEAERFTDSLELGPASLLHDVRELRSRETRVAQAMFGRSLFAVPRTRRARTSLIENLSHLRLRAVEVPFARRGARLLSRSPKISASPSRSSVRSATRGQRL